MMDCKNASKSYEFVKIREVYEDGRLVEKTEERQTRRGDWTVSDWRLERRYPEPWSLSSPGMEERIKKVREELAEILNRPEEPKLAVNS